MTNHATWPAGTNLKHIYKAASDAPDVAKGPAPRIALRLTEQELAKLKTLSNGISVSAYVRKCVFGKEVAAPAFL